MANQLHSSVIKERAKALRKLSEQKKRAYYRGFIGKDVAVLVQNRDENGLLKGLSRNYLPVFLEGDDSLINSEQLVQITGVVREEVRGEAVAQR
jgi:threonylcarbamoyladenosine tRNA methylthiotransferase MtaB